MYGFDILQGPPLCAQELLAHQECDENLERKSASTGSRICIERIRDLDFTSDDDAQIQRMGVTSTNRDPRVVVQRSEVHQRVNLPSRRGRGCHHPLRFKPRQRAERPEMPLNAESHEDVEGSVLRRWFERNLRRQTTA